MIAILHRQLFRPLLRHLTTNRIMLSPRKKQKVSESALLIWPNCLFKLEAADIARYDQIFIVEEPMFFGHETRRKYNINKLKLAYFRASMRWYQSFLGAIHPRVTYIDYSDVDTYSFLKGYECAWFNPLDFDLDEKLASLKIVGQVLESRLFLVSNDDVTGYFKSRKEAKRFNQGQFYNWVKAKLDVLPNVPSQDHKNRQSLPKKHDFKWSTRKFDMEYLEIFKEAATYIDNHPTFSKNLGSTSKLHFYPITHQDALLQLKDFILERAANFGPYEDAIDKDEVVLFHSFISVVLNNGLLSPKVALDLVMAAKDDIPLNSLEGWVRQLCGWREYQRGIYTVFYKEMSTSNAFQQHSKLDWDIWSGKSDLGIPILNNELKKALAYGYCHHIPRLCVFLNMFVLLEICLEDVVQWFSQVVAMDAYPWVMYSNIASMGYYDPRFMQKPYVTASAYLLKMSNYPKGDWCHIWNCLFYRFLASKKQLLKGGASAYLRNLAYFEKKNEKEQAAMNAVADRYIKRVTSGYNDVKSPVHFEEQHAN